MNITIQNILGIESASIDIEPGTVTEIRGPNAAGKTSIATCLQAVLSREPNPIGLPVSAMREYAHDGAAECGAWLTTGAETWAVEWVPTRSDGAITIGADDGTESHPFAVGMADFCARMGGKQRAALLQPILLPDPKDVIEKLKVELAAYLPAEDVTGCVSEIERRGFEAAEQVYQGRSREAKRQWCKHTGRRQYGSKIAADWRPAGWTAEHDALTVLDAQKRVHEARQARDGLLRENAVSEAVLEAAQEARKKLPELQDAIDNHAEQIAVAKEARDSASAASDAKDRAYRGAIAEQNPIKARIRAVRSRLRDDAPDAHCPHCGGALAVSADFAGAKVTAHVQGETDSLQNELKALEERQADAVSHASKLSKHLAKASDVAAGKEGLYRAAISARESARRDLQDCERTAAVTGVPDTEERRRALAAVDERVQACEQVEADVKAHRAATKQADTVAHYEAILRALGPSGVRAGMLDKRLSSLNAGLSRLTTVAGWPDVAVTSGGAITCGSRPAALCSESEQWRTQAALQMTIAAMTGSAAVVLDRADLLDVDARRGLTAAAQVCASSRKRTAVVLCATGAPEDAPPWRQILIAGGRVIDKEAIE